MTPADPQYLTRSSSLGCSSMGKFSILSLKSRLLGRLLLRFLASKWILYTIWDELKRPLWMESVFNLLQILIVSCPSPFCCEYYFFSFIFIGQFSKILFIWTPQSQLPSSTLLSRGSLAEFTLLSLLKDSFVREVVGGGVVRLLGEMLVGLGPILAYFGMGDSPRMGMKDSMVMRMHGSRGIPSLSWKTTHVWIDEVRVAGLNYKLLGLWWDHGVLIIVIRRPIRVVKCLATTALRHLLLIMYEETRMGIIRMSTWITPFLWVGWSQNLNYSHVIPRYRIVIHYYRWMQLFGRWQSLMDTRCQSGLIPVLGITHQHATTVDHNPNNRWVEVNNNHLLDLLISFHDTRVYRRSQLWRRMRIQLSGMSRVAMVLSEPVQKPKVFPSLMKRHTVFPPPGKSTVSMNWGLVLVLV